VVFFGLERHPAEASITLRIVASRGAYGLVHEIEKNSPDVSKMNIGPSVTTVTPSRTRFPRMDGGSIAAEHYLRHSIHVHDCRAHQISVSGATHEQPPLRPQAQE